MNTFSWGAVLTVALGILVCLTPHYLFPVCETHIATAAGGAVPMKCFWTARASLGNGGLAVAAGCLLLLSNHAPFRFGVTLMLFFVGLVTILIPGLLIGVCASEIMSCHMGTLPALTLLGLILMITAVCMAFAARRGMSKSATASKTGGQA